MRRFIRFVVIIAVLAAVVFVGNRILTTEQPEFPSAVDVLKEATDTVTELPGLSEIQDRIIPTKDSESIPSADNLSMVPSPDSEILQVHFIDVGQGDSILLIQGDYSMLIDTGEYEMSDKLTGYLSSVGITKLNSVVATHPHSDHIGSMATIIKAYRPSDIYLPDTTYDSVSFEKMLDNIEKYNVSMHTAKSGTEYTLGAASVNIMGPVKEDLPEDINDTSLVLKVTYKGNSFLFTGDATSYLEEDIMRTNQDLKADVLKVGHHGSSTSTSEAFLDAVSPSYAVICVGENNEYDQPHDSVLKRLERNNIKTFRTDLSGSIIATSDGNNIKWYTEK